MKSSFLFMSTFLSRTKCFFLLLMSPMNLLHDDTLFIMFMHIVILCCMIILVFIWLHCMFVCLFVCLFVTIHMKFIVAESLFHVFIIIVL